MEKSRITMNASNGKQYGCRNHAGSNGTQTKYLFSFTKKGHAMDECQYVVFKHLLDVTLSTIENCVSSEEVEKIISIICDADFDRNYFQSKYRHLNTVHILRLEF